MFIGGNFPFRADTHSGSDGKSSGASAVLITSNHSDVAHPKLRHGPHTRAGRPEFLLNKRRAECEVWRITLIDCCFLLGASLIHLERQNHARL